MYHCPRPRDCLGIGLISQDLQIINSPKPKYSDFHWDFRNKLNFQISNTQDKLSERIIEETKRTIDDTNELTLTNKKEVDFQLKEHVTEIEYLIDELRRLKEAALIEEDALKLNKLRIQNASKYLKEKSLPVCNKCLILREGRLSTDSIDDEVNRQLNQEAKVINGCLCILEKAFRENNEQIRKLKSEIYLIDRDLSNKDRSLIIDRTNLTLKENKNQLKVYHGKEPLVNCEPTFSEWITRTYTTLENTAKELNSTAQLRSYIELILKQIVDDLSTQRDRTNHLFGKRISEMKKVKNKIEDKHNKTIMQVNNITRHMELLEKEICKTEGYLGVCQMRLGNRAHRPRLEATCDIVHDTLVKELQDLKNTIGSLNNKYLENQSARRYLLHAQIMQEEEINLKTNSIKIDEVDCMVIRNVLLYQSF